MERAQTVGSLVKSLWSYEASEKTGRRLAGSESTEHTYGEHEQLPIDKLRMLQTPLITPRSTGLDDGPAWDDGSSSHHARSGTLHWAEDLPKFKRYPEPTLLEIFFDLFFAANYNVFAETQQVTDRSRFKAHIGYFCLLWITWFLVTMFDVRYVTDSFFSRTTRAVQFGVLIGFAVVAPKFDPSDQHVETMQTMSFILCVSRVVMAIEYGTTLWHTRAYKKARRPLCLQIAIHIVAAIIYLAVAFAFESGQHNRLYVAWYFVSGAEALSTILLSNISPVLSITETHIMKRMTLLTVLFLGDSIVQIAKTVVTIVKNPDSWDAVTIGLLTAAVITIYFIFLTYFDWLRSSFYLPPLRQQLWTALHLPFHLALNLFIQGFTQILLWSKIVTMFRFILATGSEFDMNTFTNESATTMVTNGLNESIQSVLRDYHPKGPSTMDTINLVFENITSIPEALWRIVVSNPNVTEADIPPELKGAWQDYVNTLVNLIVTLINVLFSAFGIDIADEIIRKDPKGAQLAKSHDFQFDVQHKSWERYSLMFAYGYVSCSCTIVLMVALAVIARLAPYKPWHIIRLGIVFALAVGTGFVATLCFNEDGLENYLFSAWVLPPIAFVWTAIFIITHINGEGVRRNLQRYRKSRWYNRSRARRE
ncbi:hypothetical protein HIM_06319 [Hirsutella minnesotensis 3608]|uniref:Low temperature requirement A n=1 Tax=Hirsutella minnesotensis 3608 TaxID=1043627 RepID=A0A0F7ZU63_9HYPO|nr:hypothetical protein HIM_06319 [Hirsutella minnesotensis 3608]